MVKRIFIIFFTISSLVAFSPVKSCGMGILDIKYLPLWPIFYVMHKADQAYEWYKTDYSQLDTSNEKKKLALKTSIAVAAGTAAYALAQTDSTIAQNVQRLLLGAAVAIPLIEAATLANTVAQTDVLSDKQQQAYKNFGTVGLGVQVYKDALFNNNEKPSLATITAKKAIEINRNNRKERWARRKEAFKARVTELKEKAKEILTRDTKDNNK